MLQAMTGKMHYVGIKKKWRKKFYALNLTYTVIMATDVFQFITKLTLAVVASKCVDTSAVESADSSASGAFINI